MSGPSPPAAPTPEAAEPSSRRSLRSWWLSSGFGPHTLDNTGSVARDHLASERTYLAWLRTSLAFASIGVAITQLFSLASPLTADPIPAPSIPSSVASDLTAQVETLTALYAEILATVDNTRSNRPFARALGGLFIGLSILILLLGSMRYFTVQTALLRNQFPASRLPVFALSLVTTAIVVVVLGIVIGRR